VHAQKVPANYKAFIAEAYQLSKAAGSRVFNGFQEIPFTTLLLTDSAEFLFLHPLPSADFRSTGDSLFSVKIFSRISKFNKYLLATFPAVNGKNCIVVGTPENTGRSPAEWIVTLLH